VQIGTRQIVMVFRWQKDKESEILPFKVWRMQLQTNGIIKFGSDKKYLYI
jgi:hypothetical protein